MTTFKFVSLRLSPENFIFPCRRCIHPKNTQQEIISCLTMLDEEGYHFIRERVDMVTCFSFDLKMDSQLFTLLHGFFSLTPVNALRFPSRLPAVQINNFLLNNLLLNQHFQQFPPSSQYQKRFLKWAITHLETTSRKYNIEEACLIFFKSIHAHQHDLARIS